MGGTPWANSTSTTGPMICTTRPTFCAGAFCVAMLVLTPSFLDPPPCPSPRRGRGLRLRDRFRAFLSSTPQPTLPTLGEGVAASRSAPRFLRFSSARRPRPRHHLDDLLGDGRLADLVH